MDELRTSFENKQISRATYFRKKKALREGKCNKRKEGSGRPRKLKGKLMQKLCSIALRNPYISAQKMANRLKSENDIDIHKRTIQRNLKKSGIKKDVVTLQMRLNLMRSISKRLARVILENGNQIK